MGEQEDASESNLLIETDLADGVIAVPISKYHSFNTRICRPLDSTEDDRQKVAAFMVDRLGMHHDPKNVIDLLRYLMPAPPVPTRRRRRMLALGSGDPTRAICSTIIALVALGNFLDTLANSFKIDVDSMLKETLAG